MLNRSEPIVETSLRGLHPESIDDATQIRALLERARRSGSILHRGLNASIDLETALIERIDDVNLVLSAPNFERLANGQVFLNFNCDGRPYFFATTRAAPFLGDRLTVRIPDTVFYSERRDRPRWPPDRERGDPWRVEVGLDGGGRLEGRVEDLSPGGLGLLLRGEPATSPRSPLRVRFLDGRESGREARLQLRNSQPVAGQTGWTRVGLVRTPAPIAAPIEPEYRSSILDESCPESAPLRTDARSAADTMLRPARVADSGSGEPRVLRFENRRGEEIVALLDSWGDTRGAPAVVIPNGWGQTKEALLPLARTVVAAFRAAAEPVSVLRFDGIRKRGESHNDPECRVPGREHHHFVFSQGVEDIDAVVNFLHESPEFGPSSLILVSFSAAAIEARKALARDRGRRIDGWVCVVGSPDLQSMTRSISGGVDFAAGYERGLRFGFQELLGVVVDIDRIAADSGEHEMIFIEDSRRDLAEIRVPISWFHGQYDAWVDLDRVRDILSQGDTRKRRLIVIPAGHQLKTSRQASETFQCVAREVGRMSLTRDLPPVAVSSQEIRRLRLAEHRRLPQLDPDLQSFWRDYLIGRDRSLGIELLASGSAYRSMMDLQIRSLALQPGDRVADLGSGTGAFELQLAHWRERPASLRITSFDYVIEALQRARNRLSKRPEGRDLAVGYLEADLDLVRARQAIPAGSERFDAVIASLLLSYLERPDLVLAEVYRLLRPGGRLVVSSLCTDADISRLYVESLAEFQVGAAGADLPELRRVGLDRVARNFLNDAARILDLEEAGAFHFWEPDELAGIVARAGFGQIETRRSLGTPPQAVVLVARRL